MTFNEFKAWLDGYEASFAQHGPDAQQWADIKARLASVSTVLPASPAPSGSKWPSIEPSLSPIVSWQDERIAKYMLAPAAEKLAECGCNDTARIDEMLAGNVIETPSSGSGGII